MEETEALPRAAAPPDVRPVVPKHHARDPKTGSTDFLADTSIWIVRHVPGLRGSPHAEAWIYDHLGLGTFRLAQALNLHWVFAYLFMANGALYLIGLLAGGGYRALLPRRSDPRRSEER